MLVKELMTRSARIANPENSLQQVAQIMAEENVGGLPVGENDRLVGMITDRDIAVRAVALAKPPDTTKVRDIMSPAVKYCFADDDIANVATNMGDVQLHRLPVVNNRKRLVGILSLSDIAKQGSASAASRAIHGIAQDFGTSH